MRRAVWCDGGGPASVFSALSHGEEPPREPWEHWAASQPLLWFHALMLLAPCGANCLRRRTKHLSFFFYSLLSSRCSSRSSSHLRVVLYSSPSFMRYDHNSSCSPATLIPSLSQCLHPICFLIFQAESQFFPARLLLILLSSPCPSSLCSTLAARSFAFVPSTLLCHQLLHTQSRVITFVLHRVSLIRFLPPFRSTSALEGGSDWSLLSSLSHKKCGQGFNKKPIWK